MQINYEIENKKSKFLGFVIEVENVSQIKNILEQLRTAHKKATHICYAYIISSPNQEKCSDDNEPNGTAGKPILNVLQKRNLSNILICVVRFFGGVKLGAGTLTRMYSKCASEALNNFQKNQK